jgi:anti-sigma factor RsiW
MSCASYDLKAYQLGEASAAERRTIEQHARGCAACGDELARLNLTQAALRSVRDEDPPRRIAFVSDKVFEPKWYKRPLGPAWGFGSIAALAAAIVFHALWTPATIVTTSPMASVVHKSPAPAGLSRAVVETMVQEAEARGEKRTRALLAEAEKRHQFESAAMNARFAVGFEELSKKYYNLYKMTASVDPALLGAGR